MEEGPDLSRHMFIFQLQNTAGLLQNLSVGLSGKSERAGKPGGLLENSCITQQ